MAAPTVGGAPEAAKLIGFAGCGGLLVDEVEDDDILDVVESLSAELLGKYIFV